LTITAPDGTISATGGPGGTEPTPAAAENQEEAAIEAALEAEAEEVPQADELMDE